MPFIVILVAYYNEMNARNHDICYKKAIHYLKTNSAFLDVTQQKRFYFVGFGSKNTLQDEPTKADYTIQCIANINRKKIGLFIEIKLDKKGNNQWKVTSMKVNPPISSFNINEKE